MSCERSMASLLVTMLLVMLVATVPAGGADNLFEEPLDVFEKGKFTPFMVNESTIKALKPPKPMVIITPKEAGVYPLLFFIHGTAISNLDYTQLFNFIASHGIIVVAPMLFNDFFNFPILPSHQEEIDDAADVANWLSSNLNTPKSASKPSGHILPNYVVANFSSFTVSGHSRGGKSAFALVLGKTQKTKLTTKISGLIGIDPVAGRKVGPFKFPTTPYILNNKANSLDMPIPTMIIGTGLGGSCAPEGLNHDEFYKECKTGSHFVITDYGHSDMLNDYLTILSGIIRGGMCATASSGPYEVMRKTVGGLIVAFFDAYSRGNAEQYHKIIANPTLAPTMLDHVGYKGQTRLYDDA